MGEPDLKASAAAGLDFDATGKATLDHIYTQPDPRAYFAVLREFDYYIPQLAKPYFRALIDSYRSTRRVAVPRVVDLGCSYGVNAALLRCNASMDELYRHYAEAAEDSVEQLRARDRELAAGRRGGVSARFVGLDASQPALDYAVEAGLLDDTVHADFERADPTVSQVAALARTDVVISTGCLGYVGASTLARLVSAARRPPWMLHFALRMFPYDPIADRLADFGYQTVCLEGLFRQRRFVSAEEQAQVLDTLASVGVDPSGRETRGWLYAQPFLSRPSPTA
jgi:carnitine O-acetyltransferase